ncbi:hypothetical protein AB0L63_24875 [Nocardia sp. NPDC051990]
MASASFGESFAVAAHTRGTPQDQTADVGATLPYVLMSLMARMTG